MIDTVRIAAKTIGKPLLQSIVLPEAKKAGKKAAGNAAKKTARKSVLPLASVLIGAAAGVVVYKVRNKD